LLKEHARSKKSFDILDGAFKKLKVSHNDLCLETKELKETNEELNTSFNDMRKEHEDVSTRYHLLQLAHKEALEANNTLESKIQAISSVGKLTSQVKKKIDQQSCEPSSDKEKSMEEKFDEQVNPLRKMSYEELELCLKEMTEEKDDILGMKRTMGVELVCLREEKQRLIHENQQVKKNLGDALKASKLCAKCKNNNGSNPSEEGNIIIKLKDKNDKLKSEMKSLSTGYKTLVKGNNKFSEMLANHSKQFEKNGIRFPPMKAKCKPPPAPKVPK